MLRKLFFALIMIPLPGFIPGRDAVAQITPADGNTTISEVLGEAVSADDGESDPAALADEMAYFLDHPLNLNIATREELRQLHLLTEFQIFSLTDYIRENGELLSIFELQLVYGFDPDLITRLLPFVSLSSQKTKSGKLVGSRTRLKQLLVFRTGLDGNTKSGFIADTSGRSEFQGANRALMLRYEAGISNIGFGFTMDQDAGESFRMEGRKPVPDFNSAYLEYRSHGALKKIITGDYRVSWGQGLVLGGYGTRKGTQTLISPVTTGIKKYSSAGENDFFRGIASSWEWGNVNIELFASRMKTDAGLHYTDNDSLQGSYLTSSDASGLHRTQDELRKKNAVTVSCLGAHTELRRGNFSVGMSYLNQQFSHKWVRNSTAYTGETFESGTNLQNFASDFKVSLGKAALFGELAADTKGRTALLGGVLAELHPLVKVSMVYRNYQPDYLALRSSGFGESQGTKNEKGYYLGLQLYPWKYLKAELYADHYSFPFLRYTSTSPYSGNDYLLNLTFYPSREFTLSIRLRYEKTRERSSSTITGIPPMETVQKGGSRLELNYVMSKNLRLKSRIEFSYYQEARQSMGTGFYSGHDMSFASNSQKYKLWLRYAVFDIPGWENRIYAYENDVLYSFSVPAFNSRGTRFIIMGKAELLPGLELSLRYALTQFQGIRTWGTGNDEISSDLDSNWTLQLRLKI